MKVLLVGTAGKYGAQKSLKYLAVQLKNMGLDIEVLLPENNFIATQLRQSNIKCHVVKYGLYWRKPEITLKGKVIYWCKTILNCIAEYRLGQIIKKNNIDIIHINSIGIPIGYESAKKNHKKLICHIREFVEEDLNRYFYNKKKHLNKVAMSDCIIANSYAVYEKFYELIPNAKFSVVYNGIFEGDYEGERKQLFMNDKVEIAFVGRICPEKGQRDLILALSKMGDNLNKVHVSIWGDTNGDGTELGALREIVKEKQLEQNVTFAGYCDNIAEKLMNSDICVVGSKCEAFGRVTVEAFMAKCLVIGTTSGGTKELIADNRGLGYEYGNAQELAEQIVYAISHPNEMVEHVERAYDFAMKQLTAKKNAENILKVYKEVGKNE